VDACAISGSDLIDHKRNRENVKLLVRGWRWRAIRTQEDNMTITIWRHASDVRRTTIASSLILPIVDLDRVASPLEFSS
jgi:hypothetical protein